MLPRVLQGIWTLCDAAWRPLDRNEAGCIQSWPVDMPAGCCSAWEMLLYLQWREWWLTWVPLRETNWEVLVTLEYVCRNKKWSLGSKEPSAMLVRVHKFGLTQLFPINGYWWRNRFMQVSGKYLRRLCWSHMLSQMLRIHDPLWFDVTPLI